MSGIALDNLDGFGLFVFIFVSLVNHLRHYFSETQTP